jgi:preprotein translocase subunit YajC
MSGKNHYKILTQLGAGDRVTIAGTIKGNAQIRKDKSQIRAQRESTRVQNRQKQRF